MQSTQKMGSEGTIRDLVFGELSVWKLLNPDSAALIHILGECSCCILVTLVMIFSLFSVKVVTVSNDNWIINTWSLWICLLHSRWMPWSLSWGQLLCLTQGFNSIPSEEAARGMQEKTTHFPLFFFLHFFRTSLLRILSFCIKQPLKVSPGIEASQGSRDDMLSSQKRN